MNEYIKIKILKAVIRTLVKPMFGPPCSVPVQRIWLNAMSAISLLPKSTRTQNVSMNGMAAELVSNNFTDESSKSVVLYLHGGAFCIGSAKTHRSLTSNLAKKAMAKVYVPEYRLAPDHAFPAAIDDCLQAYEFLLGQGVDAKDIIIAGDSAGASLVMATALRIKQKNLMQPSGLVLISPWVDLTLPNAAHIKDKFDPLLSWSSLKAGAKHYLQGHDAQDPSASANYADLSGLPPMLIQVGTEEILLGDSKKLNQQAKKHDVDVTFTIYQKAWHVFQLQAGLLNMADDAIDEIVLFIKRVSEPAKKIKQEKKVIKGECA